MYAHRNHTNAWNHSPITLLHEVPETSCGMLSTVCSRFFYHTWWICRKYQVQKSKVAIRALYVGLFRSFLPFPAYVRVHRLRQRRICFFCGSSRELPYYRTRTQYLRNVECPCRRTIPWAINRRRTNNTTRSKCHTSYDKELGSPVPQKSNWPTTVTSIEARVIQSKITTTSSVFRLRFERAERIVHPGDSYIFKE